MNKVLEFHTRAQECLKQAAVAKTPDIRMHYEGLAAMWLKLAEERLTFFVEETGRASPTDGLHESKED